MANIYDKIDDLYNKGGYFTRYAGSFWFTVIVCIIVFIALGYYHIKNEMKPILKDWAVERCNPAVIPFAGWINSDRGDNKSNLEYTGDNFVHCTQTILQEITEYAFQPIYYVMSVFTDMFKEMSEAINNARAMFNRVRNTVKKQTGDIMGRSLNLTMPLSTMMIKTNDILSKGVGAMTASLYTVMGGVITLESLFLFIYELVINILYMMVAFILLMFAIGWLWPPNLVVGLIMAAFMAIILIPVGVVIVLMLIFLGDVFSAANLDMPPPIPGYCFAGDSHVTMNDGTIKCMKDIIPGDILVDGAVVTGIMKSTSANSEIYMLDGVLVTGNHQVYHPQKGWMQAQAHPNSILYNNFREPFIYCISTSTKVININGHIFGDWDELEEYELQILRNSSNDLPDNLERTDLHYYLETGLHPDTEICLEDGRSIPIKDVEVNDVLLFGEEVKTIIVVKSDDIIGHESVFYDGEKILSCTKNTEVYLDSLGSQDLLTRELSEPFPLAYHLITNKRGFRTKGVIIGDYNRGVDRHLPDEYFNESQNETI